MLKQIPLATSNGCKISTKKYQYVVSGELLDNGDMKLHFSDDYGASLYTDDEDLCPKAYVATKLDGNEGGRRRSLSDLPRPCTPGDELYDITWCQANSLPSVCPMFPGYEYLSGGFGCTPANIIFGYSYVLAQCPISFVLPNFCLGREEALRRHALAIIIFAKRSAW